MARMIPAPLTVELVTIVGLNDPAQWPGTGATATFGGGGGTGVWL